MNKFIWIRNIPNVFKNRKFLLASFNYKDPWPQETAYNINIKCLTKTTALQS